MLQNLACNIAHWSQWHARWSDWEHIKALECFLSMPLTSLPVWPTYGCLHLTNYSKIPLCIVFSDAMVSLVTTFCSAGPVRGLLGSLATFTCRPKWTQVLDWLMSQRLAPVYMLKSTLAPPLQCKISGCISDFAYLNNAVLYIISTYVFIKNRMHLIYNMNMHNSSVF